MITARENILMAYHHEEPYWVPSQYLDQNTCVYTASQEGAQGIRRKSASPYPFIRWPSALYSIFPDLFYSSVLFCSSIERFRIHVYLPYSTDRNGCCGSFTCKFYHQSYRQKSDICSVLSDVWRHSNADVFHWR